MPSPEIEADRLLSSHEVGALLQVSPGSVNKWVNEGGIPAFRTPGGHRRIRVEDLVEFLGAHKMPVPLSLAGTLRRRLLVVDEDDAQLAALGRTLEPHRRQVEVLLMTNGFDALVQVGLFRPHLIVLDIALPELDGLTIWRRLKAGDSTSAIEVIVVSDDLSAELARRAFAAVGLRCVRKPIDLQVLLQALHVNAPAHT